jgi:threonine dehydrogenase-like Zn-dependent dehydrogenase
MRATLMYRAGDVRIEKVPDARLIEPTDAVITITAACICGSDLWPYKELEPVASGRPMGHEAIGRVEAIGKDVRRIKVGDLVVMPFAYSDGTCEFCHDGLNTSCVHTVALTFPQFALSHASVIAMMQSCVHGGDYICHR